MAIGTYDEYMEPLLRVLGEHPDGIQTQQAYEELARRTDLSQEERDKRLPSGLQPVYQNRIGWAHDRLKRVGASSSPRRGLWRITPAGQQFLARHLKPFTLDELQREFSLVDGDVPDPTIRIGMLPAATRAPVSVSRDTSVSEALTQMLLRDYSQLPVMQGERIVHGVVSWKSIGRARLAGTPEFVRDCMDDHVEKVKEDDDLFHVLDKIIANDFVLVIDGQNRLSGIVTVSDVSQQFREMSEPYLLLGSIENQIRHLIAGKFPLETLRAARGPGNQEREIAGLFDFTFAEYVSLLGNEANWRRLELPIDRRTFVNALDRVREIRNAVMHFDPDDLEEESIRELRDVARLLQTVSPKRPKVK